MPWLIVQLTEHVPLTGSGEEWDCLPDVDSQRNAESQGDVEQSGNVHYSSQG